MRLHAVGFITQALFASQKRKGPQIVENFCRQIRDSRRVHLQRQEPYDSAKPSRTAVFLSSERNATRGVFLWWASARSDGAISGSLLVLCSRNGTLGVRARHVASSSSRRFDTVIGLLSSEVNPTGVRNFATKVLHNLGTFSFLACK